MKLKHFIAVIGVVVSVNAMASGIPVFDGAAAANFLQQIEQLRQQYQQLKITSSALNGSNNIGQMMMSANPLIREYLPENLQSMYDEMARATSKGGNGSYKGLDGTLEAIEDAARARSTWEKMSEAQNNKAKLDVAALQASYDGAIQRLNNLEALTKQVGSTPTAKESQDLTARINAENAMLESETNRVNLMVAMQNAQDKLMQSERKQIIKDRLSTENVSIPRF